MSTPLMHTYSDSSAEKHRVQHQLALLALDELTQRAVTDDDVRAFRRFAVPGVFHAAHRRSRPLTPAEARAVAALVNPPKYTNSVRVLAQPSDMRYQTRSESVAADFIDYKFSNADQPNYRTQPHTGRINNPPFVLPPE